jgi:lipopolysaccharide transport system ATP-binding protein
MRRMRNLMDSGVTTLFVSHDSGAIKTLCNSAVMIHDGKMYTSGLPNAVIIEYMKLLTDLELNISQSHEPKTAENHIEKIENNLESSLQNNQQLTELQSETQKEKVKRRGSSRALIEKVKLLNQFGEDDGESPIFSFNEEVTLVANIKAYEALKSCLLGFYICDKNGNEIIGTNTFEENIKIGAVEVGETIQVRFKFKLPLRNGSYSLTVAAAESYQVLTLDWIDNAIVFQVLPPDTGKTVHALIDHPVEVEEIRLSRLLESS